MNYDNIDFSKLFVDKHGKRIYDEIISAIKKEKVGECDSNYINTIFKVAFMGYFGLDNKALDKMLKDIDINYSIENINNIHENSIRTIKEYIEKTK